MVALPFDPGLGRRAEKPETLSAPTEGASETPCERRSRRIDAFHHRFRPAIAQLTAGRSAREDLAESFPALLFALASGFASAEARSATLAMIDDGASLRDAALRLGVPAWLRRLPAGALATPLPPFSLDTAVGQRMATLVPADAAAARIWLDAVIVGWRGCSEEFALWVAGWIARQQRQAMLPFAERNMRLLAAWAWHADRPETLPHRLLRRPWTPAIGHRRAFDELIAWRQRIDLALVLAARRGRHDAPAAGEALGYQFLPLESAEDFVTEADIMDNCLDQFADRLATRYSRVYSVRRHGRSVATIEIGAHDEEASMPAIRQLRAVRNRRAAPEIWQAAYAWLGSQTPRPVPALAARGDTAGLRAEARRLWEPYLAAVESRWPAAEFRSLSSAMIRSDVERAESYRRTSTARRARRTSTTPAT